ncbi:hypothetical protein L209DRAFT_574097 [Thermothelomyces heterothallicus CBS 203.75]
MGERIKPQLDINPALLISTISSIRRVQDTTPPGNITTAPSYLSMPAHWRGRLHCDVGQSMVRPHKGVGLLGEGRGGEDRGLGGCARHGKTSRVDRRRRCIADSYSWAVHDWGYLTYPRPKLQAGWVHICPRKCRRRGSERWPGPPPGVSRIRASTGRRRRGSVMQGQCKSGTHSLCFVSGAVVGLQNGSEYVKRGETKQSHKVAVGWQVRDEANERLKTRPNTTEE